jgi:DNA-binding CsgD family transcriptional regulator
MVKMMDAANSVRDRFERNENTMRWGEGMLDAFERAGWGGLLIGADGCVIGLNGEARRQVGREIALGQGRIAAMHRPANAELQRLVAGALSAENEPPRTSRGAILLPRANARPLMAHVISIAGAGGDCAQRAKAMVVLVDLDQRPEPAESVLREAFGLTPAETRIAIDFARGRDLQEIADDQKVSVGTVRKHFKAILAKTNTNRQAELVILLSRLAQQPHLHPAVPAALGRPTRSAPCAES